MQYAMQVFETEDNDPIRVMDRNGESLVFILSEVCKKLGIGNTTCDAASRLDEDEKGVATIDTLAGKQQLASSTIWLVHDYPSIHEPRQNASKSDHV